MRLLIIASVFLMSCLSSRAQNLVPNWSFEDYHQCPNDLADFVGFVSHWFKPTPNTSDYYNVCAGQPSPVGVPKNSTGYQWPRSGGAYAGIVVYHKDQSGLPGPREYIGVKLTEPLLADSLYCVEFFAVKWHLSPYAISSLGLHLSTDSIFVVTGIDIPLLPHILNPDSNFLEDTLNWTRIGGEYIAQGGEQFIYIGNFFDNDNTSVNITNPLATKVSYYYIDDVTVSKCSNFGVGVNALVGKEKQLLNAFPNPSTGSLTIDYTYESGMAYLISVSDLAGRIVYKGMVSAGARMITLSHLTDGAYLVQLSKNDRVVGHSKLILLK